MASTNQVLRENEIKFVGVKRSEKNILVLWQTKDRKQFFQRFNSHSSAARDLRAIADRIQAQGP